jgi:hypothetical protein
MDDFVDRNADFARSFRILAGRFRSVADRAPKKSHISSSIVNRSIQAARLLWLAICADAFPADRKDRNGAWWCVDDGRIPGGVLTLGADGAGGIKPLDINDTGQCQRLWMLALAGWLVPRFPHRFQHEVPHQGFPRFKRINGVMVDKDGMPLRVAYSYRGKPVDATLAEAGKARWDTCEALNAPIDVRDEFDELDWIEDLRVQADSYADACDLLADLLITAVHAAKHSETARSSSGTKFDPAAAQRSISEHIRNLLAAGTLIDAITIKSVAKSVGVSVGWISEHSRTWKLVADHKRQQIKAVRQARHMGLATDHKTLLDQIIAEQEDDAAQDRLPHYEPLVKCQLKKRSRRRS